MRATKPVLGAITLAVLLGSTACGADTVTVRPASVDTTIKPLVDRIDAAAAGSCK